MTGVYWSSNSSVRSCRDRHPASLCLHLARYFMGTVFSLFRTGMWLPLKVDIFCFEMQRKSWIRSEIIEGWLDDLRSNTFACIIPRVLLTALCLSTNRLESLNLGLDGGSGGISKERSLLRDWRDVERLLNPGLGSMPLRWTRSRYMLCGRWHEPLRPKLFTDKECRGSAALLVIWSRLTHRFIRLLLTCCTSKVRWQFSSSSSKLPITGNLSDVFQLMLSPIFSRVGLFLL